jgi:hypothetical protein
MLSTTDLLRLYRYYFAIILLLSTCLLLTSCDSNRPSSLAITSWGPNSTQAGVAFNAQPGGSAAFWVKMDQEMHSNAYISLNDFVLSSTVSGKLITAGVPAALYAQPGTYPLCVVEVIGGKEVKSNCVDFVVKPK